VYVAPFNLVHPDYVVRTVSFSHDDDDDDDDDDGGGDDGGGEDYGSVNHRSRQSVFYPLCLAILDVEKQAVEVGG